METAKLSRNLGSESLFLVCLLNTNSSLILSLEPNQSTKRWITKYIWFKVKKENRSIWK